MRPIDVDLYQQSLKEVVPLTFPGYLTKVADYLNDGSTENRIQNVRRGLVKNWKVLNAIRVIVGLPEVTPAQMITKDEVAGLMKLDKSA